MDIKQKVSIFAESCEKLLQKEVNQLNKNINTEIERQIKDELKDYQEKEESAYHKKIEKLEKEFNKQIYSLEMDSKREILEEKKILQKELKKEVISILKDFTKKSDYKIFLMRKIDEAVQKLKNTNTAILRIVDFDNQKYGDEICEKYKIKIEIMDEHYIGGCILEDKVAGIYIDNTIQNSIEEKLG